MKELVEELAEFKMLFLSPSVKNALLRLSAWITVLFNYMDN